MKMYTEKDKQYTMKYLAKLKEIRFRVKPEEYEKMQKAAKELGFTSMRQFYLASINNMIYNVDVDDDKPPTEHSAEGEGSETL